MKRIHFIVNPIAGKGNHRLTKGFFEHYFEPEEFIISVRKTVYKKHAIPLAKQAMKDGVEVVVACGGDGTINEIASVLVGSHVKLGIIPIGSGNGLASNLKISKNITKAMMSIKVGKTIQIDVGSVNGTYFFSNAGFGFDAEVIKNYEASENRSFYSYIKAALISFKEYSHNKKLIIKINETAEVVNPFLIFVSNSNELGYKMSLTPKASLQDGLLDVVIVPKIGKLKMLLFALCMLLKRPDLLKWVECYRTNSLFLYRIQGSFFQSQIDGELKIIEEASISIGLKNQALHVLV